MYWHRESRDVHSLQLGRSPLHYGFKRSEGYFADDALYTCNVLGLLVPWFYDFCRLHKLERRELASVARVEPRLSVNMQGGEGVEGVPQHCRRN